MQLFTARPSTSTVHAPHWLVSQPTCVPGQPETVAQRVDEQRAPFDLERARLAVDDELDVAQAPAGRAETFSRR